MKSISILFLSLVVSLLNIFISFWLFSKDLCIKNEGVAFGIDVIYIIFITLAVVIVLILLGLISKGFLRYIFFSFVLLGISNFVVRVIYGSVCDYINIFNLVVNISDILMVLLSIDTCIHILFFDKKK